MTSYAIQPFTSLISNWSVERLILSIKSRAHYITTHCSVFSA